MTRYSVLVVDDEENVSRLLTKVLQKEGYRVYTASNGVEAIETIHSNNIDIVITDLKMPVMGGIELLKEIDKIDTSISVIIITAFATLETAIEALKIGAKDYITKPFNIEDIVESVGKIVKVIEGNEEKGSLDKQDDKSYKGYLQTKSIAMFNVMEMITRVADTKSTVMIYGETGTGKELAAKAIHNLSSRRDKPYIKVNCAAIPEALLESELFGYEKGAFTGAVNCKLGKFELAEGGSIFLDEIGDISPGVQVKILRVLQEREIERLGGVKTIKLDVRIIAATNRDLQELVNNNEFRSDLYYRLNVVPIKLPSLRERCEDIPLLVERFLEKSSDISGKLPKTITRMAMEKLIDYDWPGNIRELENIIERCVVITAKSNIDVEDLPYYLINKEKHISANRGMEKLDQAVDNVEKQVIIRTLKECSGNRTKTAEALGISRRSLHRKMQKYEIED